MNEGQRCMIRDIKTSLCTNEVYSIYSASMFEPSFQKFAVQAAKTQSDPFVHAFGYFLDKTLVGIVVVRESSSRVEVIGIAVSSDKRYTGIGTKLIDYIKSTFKMVVVAETDNDAAKFYKKCGFTVQEKLVSKGEESYNRFVCTLK